jgi:uncharacterized membrane protein YcfT
MPDFFLISGLFLSLVIGRDWRTYLDRKVVHFAYFYLLWMTIQFVVKAPGIAAGAGVSEVARLYALSLIDPFGTLWFIYLLPIFFVVTKLTACRRGCDLADRRSSEIAPIHTGWTVIDEFAGRFVYFYRLYLRHPHLRFAAGVPEQRSRGSRRCGASQRGWCSRIRRSAFIRSAWV